MTAVPQLGEADRTCRTCIYWSGRGTGRAEAPCLASPPVPLLRPDGSVFAARAPVPPDWHCGEWSPPRLQMQPHEQERVDAAVRADMLGVLGRADALQPPMQERQGRLGGVR